jgi:hypothetical protein
MTKRMNICVTNSGFHKQHDNRTTQKVLHNSKGFFAKCRSLSHLFRSDAHHKLSNCQLLESLTISESKERITIRNNGNTKRTVTDSKVSYELFVLQLSFESFEKASPCVFDSCVGENSRTSNSVVLVRRSIPLPGLRIAVKLSL